MEAWPLVTTDFCTKWLYSSMSMDCAVPVCDVTNSSRNCAAGLTSEGFSGQSRGTSMSPVSSSTITKKTSPEAVTEGVKLLFTTAPWKSMRMAGCVRSVLLTGVKRSVASPAPAVNTSAGFCAEYEPLVDSVTPLCVAGSRANV